MTPFNAIPQPIPVYDEIEYQYWRRKECTKGQANRVFQKNDKLPFFLIARKTSPYDTFSIVLRNAHGDTVNMGVVSMQIRTVEDMDYIWPTHNVVLPLAIPEGLWYMELTDNGGNHFFTEWINFTSCTDDKVELRFGDVCMQRGVPYQVMRHVEIIHFEAVQVHERFSFWIERGHGKPTTKTETEVTDNGAETVIKSQKTIKQYIIHDVLPDYAVQCFHAMKYLGNVSLHDPSTGLEVGGKVGNITGEWVASDCLFNTTVELQLDEEWRSECCDPNTAFEDACGLPNVQGLPYAGRDLDFGWFSSQPEGIPFLITEADPEDPSNDFSAHRWEIAVRSGSDITYTVPEVGTIFLIGEEFTLQARGDLYNYTQVYMEVIADGSSPNGIQIVYLNPTPVIEPVDAYGSSFTVYLDYSTDAIQALGRFARITIGTSLHPDHPSTQVVWTGPESDLLGNPPTVTNPYAGQDVWVRIQYFRHGCEYGTSYFNAFVSDAVTIQMAGDAANINCSGGNYLVVSDVETVTDFEPGDVVSEGEVVLHLNVGQRIQASVDGEWWVMTESGPGKLFPNLRIVAMSGDDFTLVSEWPAVSASQARTPILSGSPDGTTWSIVNAGPESQYATSYVLNAPGGHRGFLLSYIDDELGVVQLPVDVPIMFAQARDPINGSVAKIYRSVLLGPWEEVLSGACNGSSWGFIEIIRAWHVSKDNVIAAGHFSYGNIQTSQDGGNTWFTPVGTYLNPWPGGVATSGQRWFKMSWGDDGSCWVAGPRRIARSADGGFTFNDVTPPSEAMTANNPISICAIDGNTALAGCKNTIFRTTDGGSTWDAVDNTDSLPWYGDDNGYAHIENLGGGRIVAFSSCEPTPPLPDPYVLLSDDDGETFDRHATCHHILGQSSVALPTYSGNVGGMILGRDRWTSEDGGDSWNHVDACNDTLQHNAVFLVNKRLIMSTPSSAGAFPSYTVDGGRTWIQHPYTYPLHSSGMYPQSTGSTGYALIAKPRFTP